MSPVNNSHSMAKCLVILVFCVAGLWCRPVSENGNNDQAGQQDVAADDPEMMTEFLRLSTTTAGPTTVTKVIKSAIAVTTPAVIRETRSTTVTPASPPPTTKKEFQVVTAKFSPTVLITTEKSKTMTVSSEKPAQQLPISELKNPVQAVVTKPAVKETVLDNNVQPQTTEASLMAVSKQPQKILSSNLSPTMPTVQQPVTPANVQQPTVAPNNGPQRQQQIFEPQKTQMPISSMVQQPPMNPPMVQSPVMSNPPQGIPNFQQPMPSNPPFQQPSMIANNPAIQPPQRPLFPAPFSNFKQVAVPFTNNRLLSTNQKRFFIKGGNGTPLNLIPISVWQKSFSPNGNIQMLSPSVMSAPTVQ